jgi:NAD(P)H-dependent FMN reductase
MSDAPRKDPVIHIAGISGSRRAGSYTRMAVALALRGAAEVNTVTHLIDLAEFNLAFAGSGADKGPDFERLSSEVKQADGIILGTPEYHGSFSGVLKNALDLMGFEEFEGKMIGLVGVSGGAMGAFEGLNSLRNVGRALHAWVVPEQAAVPEAWKVFEGSGAVKEPRLEERLKNVGRQVARFARLHKCAASNEFLKTWEEAPANPGG